MTMKQEPMAIEALRIRLRALGDPEAVELERMLDAALKAARVESVRKERSRW